MTKFMDDIKNATNNRYFNTSTTKKTVVCKFKPNIKGNFTYSYTEQLSKIKDSFDSIEFRTATAMVKDDGLNIKLLPEIFRSSVTIGMPAVKENGYAFRYLLGTAKRNHDIIRLAEKTWPGAFQFAHPEDKDNLDLVYDIVSINGLSLEHASPRAQNNRRICDKACEQNIFAFQFTSESKRSDINFVKKYLKKNGLLLRFAPKFQDNMDVVLDAMRENSYAYTYASKNLRKYIIPFNKEAIKIIEENYRKDPENQYPLNYFMDTQVDCFEWDYSYFSRLD